MGNPQLSWSLIVQSGPLAGYVFPIQPGTQTIGRLQDNHIVIPDSSISDHHAQITLQPEGCWIADLGSTAGTFVNGQRITGSTWLRPGDTVHVGASVPLGVQTVPIMASASPVAPPPVPVPPTATGPAAVPRRWRVGLWVAGLAVLCLILLGGAVGALFLLGPGVDMIAPPEPTVIATPTLVLPPPVPTSTPSPIPCLPDADFVTDVSVPDNTSFAPGEGFTKIWRMRSSGCVPWPAGTRWVFISGDRMTAPESVAAPGTPLGSTADIAVQMQAPDTPGTYRSVWQMRGPGGAHFGDRAFVVIVVTAPTPTPTPEAASISFVTDRYMINGGECVTISWLVENVNAVYYNSQPATGAESRIECPIVTTTYELAVQHANGEWETRVLTIVVESGY